MIDEGMLHYVMERIRPQLQADGGDVEIVELDHETGTVYVNLLGSCDGCPMSALTLSQGIERVCVEHVPGVERVLPAMDPEEMEEGGIEVNVLDEDGNVTGTRKISAAELMGIQQASADADSAE